LLKFFCNKFNCSSSPGGKHAKIKGIIKDKLRIFPIPLHKELAKGTLLAIIKEAGLSKEEFIELWNE
jgi:hypothetical protein